MRFLRLSQYSASLFLLGFQLEINITAIVHAMTGHKALLKQQIPSQGRLHFSNYLLLAEIMG